MFSIRICSVSGVIAARLPRRLLDGAKAGEFELCTSEVLLAELLDVLSRGKFAARLEQVGLTLQGIVDDLRRIAMFSWKRILLYVYLN